MTASSVVASAALAQQQIPAEPVQPVAVVKRVERGAPPEVIPHPAPTRVVEEPDRFLGIAAPADGIVELVYVRPGDRVEPGQPLLTFNDRHATGLVSQLRVDIASARARIAELDSTLHSLDGEIAAAVAALPAEPPRELPADAAATIARAESVYNEAVARERRAAALQAHGIAATQELEAAQVAVRTAAESLALARREADAKAALVAATMIANRTQAESVVAQQREQRAQLVAQMAAIRQQQREAEAALTEAVADARHLVVRAPAGAVVTELAVQAGDRALAGSSLLKLDRIPPP